MCKFVAKKSEKLRTKNIVMVEFLEKMIEEHPLIFAWIMFVITAVVSVYTAFVYFITGQTSLEGLFYILLTGFCALVCGFYIFH